MKNSKTITPIIAALMLIATTAPAYALDVGVMTNTNVKVEDGRMYKGSDSKNDDDRSGDKSGSNKSDDRSKESSERNSIFSNRMKSWVVNAGTIGQVTAVATGSLTLKTASGELYTVTTTDAIVRRGEDKSTATVVVGDTIYVFGIKNTNTIVASMIIVGKTKDDVKPTTEEKRQSYLGVITAKTDTTLTILSANNTTYTVNLAQNANIWVNKNKQTNLSGFVVGDNVMVQGTLSANTISAKNLIAIHLPVGTIVGKITVVNGNTLTVLGTDNKTYTVLTANAKIKAKGGEDSSMKNLVVGDNVIVKGDLSGTTLTAETVTEGNLKGNFFHRFGNFFKGIFGKK
jgi:hypothetical protein